MWVITERRKAELPGVMGLVVDWQSAAPLDPSGQVWFGGSGYRWLGLSDR